MKREWLQTVHGPVTGQVMLCDEGLHTSQFFLIASYGPAYKMS